MIKKIFTLFLAFNLILVYSCVPTNKSTINNNNNNNTFKTKADTTTTPTPTEPVLQVKKDQSFLPTIIKKSKDIPISRSMQTTFPVNKKLEFQGITFKPIERKTIFHKALTPQEMKVKRKELMNNFIKLEKERYKKLRQDLRAKQKADLLLEKQNFKEMLKFFEKGSAEYNQLVQEQIAEREKSIAENKIERKALNAQYKSELIEFRAMLNGVLPTPTPNPNNTFGTKALLGIIDCEQAGLFKDLCYATDNALKSLIGSKPPENTNYSYSTESDVANSYELQAPESNEVIADTQQQNVPVVAPVAILDTDLEKQVKALNLPELPTCVSANIGFAQRRYDANRFLYIIDLSFSNPNSSCDQVEEVTITDQSIDPEYCNNNHIDRIDQKGVSSVEYLPSYENNRAGNYRMNVSFKMKNGKTYTETIEHQVLARGAEAFKNEIEVNYLEEQDPFLVSPDINYKNNVGFHVKNTTGDYLDITLTSSKNENSTNDKDKIFFGKCLSISEGDLLFDKKNLPSDEYILSVKTSGSTNFSLRVPFRVENTTIQASTFFLSKDTKSDNIDDINNYFDGINGSLSEIKIINDWGIEWTHNLDSIVFTPQQSELSKSLGLIKIDKNNINGITNCFVKNTLDKITYGTRLSSEKNIYDDGSNYESKDQSGHVLGDGKVYEINRNNNQLISILNKLKDSSFKQETAENCINEKGLIIGAIADLTNESKLVISDDSFLDFKLVLKDGNGNNIAWKNIKLKNRKINFITAKFNSLQTDELGLYNFQTVRNLRGNFKIELEPSHSYQTIKVKNESIASVNLQNCNNLNDDAKFYFDGLFYKGSILRFQSDVIYYSVKASGNTFIALGYAFKFVSDLFTAAEKACDNTTICRASVAIGQAASQPSTQLPPEKPPIVCGSNSGFDKNCADTSTEVQKEKTEIDKNVLALATTDGSCTSSDNKNLLDAIAKISYSSEQFDIHFPNFITNNNKIDIINKGKNNGTLFEAVKSTGFSVKSELNQDENIGLAVAIISDERNTTFKKMIANFSYLDDNTKKAENIIRNKGINITYPIIDQNHSTLVNSLSKDFNIAKKSNSVDEQVKVFLKEAYVFKTLSEKYTFKQDISISDFNILEKLKANMINQKPFIAINLSNTPEEVSNYQKIVPKLENLSKEMDSLIAETNGFTISAPTVTEKLDYKKLQELVNNMVDALKNCDKITSKSTAIEIEEIGKKIISNSRITAAGWASVNIAMSIGAASSTIGVPGEMNNLARGIRLGVEDLPQVISETSSVLKRSSQKDCVDNSSNLVLQPSRDSLKEVVDEARLLLASSRQSLITNQISSLEYDNIMKKLESSLYDFRYFTLGKKKQDFDKACDDCNRYGDENSRGNLECRINKLTPGEKSDFIKTVKIRIALDKTSVLAKVAGKTIGFGNVYDSSNNYLATVISFSGDDKDYTILPEPKPYLSIKQQNDLRVEFGKVFGVLASQIIIGEEARALNINPAVFFTQKIISNTSVQNDAEIKILETANNEFKNRNANSIVLDIFSDRVTCVYCQEVANRAKIAGKIVNSIIKLRYIDGKPIYSVETIPRDKLKIIRDILVLPDKIAGEK